MGQKINPYGFRLGPLYTWKSRWFAEKKQYRKFLLEDAKIRRALMEKLKPAGIAKVEIARSINKIDVTLYVARPGVAIGRGGTGMDDIKKFLLKLLKIDSRSLKKGAVNMEIRIEPVKEPQLNAYLVAFTVVDQLIKRIPHRRVVNQTLEKVMAAGAKGVKIVLAGRIAGAEISRKERYFRGTIPLSTIKEDIDYAEIPALTKSGYIGVKVWICKK